VQSAGGARYTSIPTLFPIVVLFTGKAKHFGVECNGATRGSAQQMPDSVAHSC
jgi:hypothetical protein